MPSSMDQLERTVVQLWEARRLAAWGDVPHGRLALLLLDNAAEMSLARTARVNLDHAEMYAGMAHLLRDVDPHDEEGWTLKRTIERETVSKKQKRQVERNFDALVDYVFGAKEFALSADFAECLKILHRYRKAAYHRDTVRADVLGPAVQILFFLCCHLLKNESHLWQAPREPDDFEAAVPPDFWTRSLPVTEQLIDTWIAKAQALHDIAVAHDALRAFAEIERPLEVIEEPVARFISDLDHMEQRRIDLMRGQ